MSTEPHRSLRSEVLTFLGINGLLWAVWALMGAGFPWPAFPTAGWTVGLALNLRRAPREERTPSARAPADVP